MIPAPIFSVPFHFPFANASDHLIFTSHQLSASTIHAFPSLSICRHLSISCRIPARRLTSLKLFQNLRSLFPTPAPTLRNQSALLKHLTYPSVAFHVPDVIPLPGHHKRVHRHLPAQPRREVSRSVRAASSGQCFRNPLHGLPAIEIKRRHSEMSLRHLLEERVRFLRVKYFVACHHGHEILCRQFQRFQHNNISRSIRH